MSSNLKTNCFFVVKEHPQWIEFWAIIHKGHMALSPNKKPWWTSFPIVNFFYHKPWGPTILSQTNYFLAIITFIHCGSFEKKKGRENHFKRPISKIIWQIIFLRNVNQNNRFVDVLDHIYMWMLQDLAPLEVSQQIHYHKMSQCLNNNHWPHEDYRNLALNLKESEVKWLKENRPNSLSLYFFLSQLHWDK